MVPAFVCAVLLTASPDPFPGPPPSATRFEDVTSSVGLPTTRQLTPGGAAWSAIGWIDWDRDGWVDLFVGGGAAEPTRIWRNVPGPQGRQFTPLEPGPLQRGVDVVAVERLRLRPERPGSSVRDGLALVHAGRSGVDVVPVGAENPWDVIPVASTGVAHMSLTHGDLDGDGAHELVALADVCGAGRAHPRGVYVLRQGPAGFRWWQDGPDGSACWPVAMVTGWADDAQPMLMVAPDFGAVAGAGFVVTPTGRVPLPPVYGMGIATADVDGDGRLDYALSSVGAVALLTGADRALSVAPTRWADLGLRFTWGLAWGDFDNDGDLALWLSSGPVEYPVEPLRAGGIQRDLFLEDGRDVAGAVGVADESDHRAIALADYDQDGRLDAALAGPDSLVLFRNTTPDVGHWLALVIPDEPATRFEIEACGVRQVREWSGGTAGALQEPLIHVGLGDCAGPATVTVTWPWRGVETLGPLAVDQRVPVEHPGGVWFTPQLAAPGAAVQVSVSLPGEVVVGGVAAVDGKATLTAPEEPGVHAFDVVQDGRPLRLRPTLEVRAVPVDVLSDPSPAWAGEPFRLLAPEGAQPGAGVTTIDDGRFVAQGAEAVFETPEGAVSVPLVGGLGTGDPPTVAVEGGKTRVSLVLTDAVGRVRSYLTPDWVVEGGTGTVTVEPPWLFAELDGAPTTFTLRSAADDRAVPVQVAPPGPVDPARSALWALEPFVAANVGDLAVVGVIARDANGRLLEVTEAPVVGDWPLVDGPRRVGELEGAPIHAFTYRVGTPGAVTATLGALRTTLHAFELPRPPVDPAQSLVGEEAGRLVFLPRDAAGQLVGPGVALEPAFEYVGRGRYERAGALDGLTVDGVPWVPGADGGWTVAPEPADGGCRAGRASASWAWIAVVGAVAALRRRR